MDPLKALSVITGYAVASVMSPPRARNKPSYYLSLREPRLK